MREERATLGGKNLSQRKDDVLPWKAHSANQTAWSASHVCHTAKTQEEKESEKEKQGLTLSNGRANTGGLGLGSTASAPGTAYRPPPAR